MKVLPLLTCADSRQKVDLNPKAKILGIAPQLVVPDVVKTTEYYRDVLGFSLLSYLGEPPVFAMVTRDGIEIHFGKADGGEIKPVSEVRKDGVDVVIWVDDIDALFDELQARLADVGHAIITRSYGREFVIHDCNGYQIAVIG